MPRAVKPKDTEGDAGGGTVEPAEADDPRYATAESARAAIDEIPILQELRPRPCPEIKNPPAGPSCALWTGYLARYFAITAATPAALFDRRLDFLNLSPAPDLAADLRPLIAS